MEQRVAVDGDVPRRQPLHLYTRPGGEHLGTVAVAGQFGRTRGAAGVEVGGDVFGVEVAATGEVVARLQGAQCGEFAHTIGQAGWRRCFVMRSHTQHRGERGHLAAQAQRLGPHAALARTFVRAIGDQHLGAGGGHQGDEFFVGEQRVQWLHDTRRLTAPQSQVVLQATGQHHGHSVLRADAQAV